ncbi:MAG: serine hydroxymethyltransferase, partial [Candidatus Electrothrix sp. EH2]|nr:serine hydroxymethyltransferase [Candidatus Electrothrix sp. EH2]
PFDKQARFVTSGIRIGTPSVTTRGLKEPEMLMIADWINRVLTSGEEEATLVRQEVRNLCETVPLYPEMARDTSL